MPFIMKGHRLMSPEAETHMAYIPRSVLVVSSELIKFNGKEIIKIDSFEERVYGRQVLRELRCVSL